MAPTEKVERARVIAAAQTWLGTPFHDGAAVKGVGVDCAQLLAAAYSEAGLIARPEIAPYSAQWFLHNDEPLFEAFVRRYAREVESPSPADIVLYRVGRSYAHGALVIAWPARIIHAFKDYGFVVETGAEEAGLKGRPRKYFSLW